MEKWNDLWNCIRLYTAICTVWLIIRWEIRKMQRISRFWLKNYDYSEVLWGHRAALIDILVLL